MNDIILNLIVLAVMILIGSLVFFLLRRRQAADEQAVIRMAVEHGWIFEPIREPLFWGLRLKSDRWLLEAVSRSSGQEAGPGSSDVVLSTTWQTDASGSTLLIGERNSQINLGNLGEMMVRQVLHQALGDDASGLKEFRIGSDSFQQRYMLWAQDPDEARYFLNPVIESMILKWIQGKPLIIRTPKSLTIELRNVRLHKAAELLSLIQLGEAMLHTKNEKEYR